MDGVAGGDEVGAPPPTKPTEPQGGSSGSIGAKGSKPAADPMNGSVCVCVCDEAPGETLDGFD
eukprot:2565175-Prorocentrum_lima.AAC.1